MGTLTRDTLFEAPADADWRPLESRDRLPDAARRYLDWAVPEDAPQAHVVRLGGTGQLKLKGWCPFRSEQVIHRERGMIWTAEVRMGALPIFGADSIVDGHGGMNWRLLGLVPVVRQQGADIDRSAAGRMAGEFVWLPTALLGAKVDWSESTDTEAVARISLQGFEHVVRIQIDGEGRPETISLLRWGSVTGDPYSLLPFGVVVEETRRFGAYRLPSCLRAGWHFGTDQYESEGVFFRSTIDEAEFR
jgi:hypothetical protein